MIKELSIIVPCYNYGNYIEECLESIFKNKHNISFDVTVIDDKSTDDSLETIKRLNDKYKFQLLENEHNCGPSKTRNIAAKNTNSKYLLYIDADDTIPDNYIRSHYQNLMCCDISYCSSKFFGSIEGEAYCPEFDKNLFLTSPFINSAAMYKRKVFESVGGYDMNICGWEDYDFWLSSYEKGYKFKKNKNTFLNYRQKSNGVSNSLDLEKTKQVLRTKHAQVYRG